MNRYPIFDTHAHYHDRRFTEDPSTDTDALLKTLFSDGIGAINDIGTDIETSRLAIALSEKYPRIYATVGMYPGSCPLTNDPSVIDETVSLFEEMLKHPKVVAIGEIGYDFYYDTVPRDIQKLWFERQMQLAEKADCPVVIHNRDAHGATMDMLCQFPNVRGVLHSFSGSAEMAAALVKRGYYISISGVVTFKNARQSVDVVREIPLQNLLIETDSPYLTPHPHRGKRNHSGYLVHVIDRIAEIKNITPDEVREATTKNACKIFRIPLL
ncbi:MAG: TatD family hydrolase [Clostridia bacterium]|nr:TatD family hydrolase [Clostridia bacterium]